MTGLVSHHVRKEARVLGAGWLACLAAVAMAGAVSEAPATLTLVAYVVGPIALGALSIGHEYNHRTMGHLLAQPVSRPRVLAVKLTVLGTMLAGLWAAAGWSATFGGRLDRGPASGFMWATWVFPILAGFCLAPWLTMLCRSALAGLVFALATPAVIWIGAVLLAVARFGVEGTDTPAADLFRLVVLWAGMIGVSIVGAVSTWRMFLRLEVLEGRGEDVRLPAWLRRPAASADRPARRRPAVWHLVLKEIRLQQMTFVVSVLFAACWLVWPLLSEALPAAAPAGSLSAIAIAHGAFVSLLAGSLASAEERQYGTREWQLILPMAASLQWAVKAGTAVAVALVLAVGLPGALDAVSPAGQLPSRRALDLTTAVMAVSMLTSGSVYVSSLSTSGVRAVIASVIALPIAVPLVGWLTNLTLSATGASRLPAGSARWVGLMNGAVLVALVLRAGLANHRTNAVGWTRVVAQLVGIAAWIVVATLVAVVMG